MENNFVTIVNFLFLFSAFVLAENFINDAYNEFLLSNRFQYSTK